MIYICEIVVFNWLIWFCRILIVDPFMEKLKCLMSNLVDPNLILNNFYFGDFILNSSVHDKNR